MTDLSKTPLNPRQLQILAMMRIPLYTDNDTGQMYVNKRYWNGIRQEFREALSRAIGGLQ